jgi:hypothetical protein
VSAWNRKTSILTPGGYLSVWVGFRCFLSCLCVLKSSFSGFYRIAATPAPRSLQLSLWSILCLFFLLLQLVVVAGARVAAACSCFSAALEKQINPSIAIATTCRSWQGQYHQKRLSSDLESIPDSVYSFEWRGSGFIVEDLLDGSIVGGGDNESSGAVDRLNLANSLEKL